MHGILIALFLFRALGGDGSTAGDPAGTVRGNLEMTAEGAIPSMMSLHYDPVPARGKMETASGTVDCPIRDKVWTCQLPPGVFDLRLKAGSMIPVYLWQVRVEPGQTRDLGAIKLRKGASVVGWVETEQGTVPTASTRVSLAREQAGQDADLGTAKRLDALSLTTRINERGFFQIEGVPPGRYVLTVEDEGFAPARIAPVEVRPDLEAQIVERVTLGRPSVLDLLLEPPADPYGRPWRVSLTAQAPATGDYEATVSPEGRWVRRGLTPGTYRLRVIGDLNSSWLNQEIEIRPGLGPVVLELPVVEVEGRLSRGGSPMPGTVWFGGRSENRRIRFEADEEGRFHGFLPEEGSWPVELVLENPGPLRVSLDPVEVRRLKGKRSARVEIAIPDTLLSGEVVDEAGRALPGVEVWAHHAEKVRKGEVNQVSTDLEGRFEILGLPPGLVSVQAEDSQRSSDWAQVPLQEGREAAGIRLVVRENFELRGRIVSPSGPVPGAHVMAIPDLGPAGISTVADVVTGPSGELTLSLPAGTKSISILVTAPGFGRRMLKSTTDRALEILVEPESGALTLDMPAGPGTPTPLLVHGGVVLPPQLLSPRARAGGSVVLEGMEIGEYALCAGTGAVAALRQGQEPPRTLCVSGFLGPHSELTLKLPSR